MTGETAAAVTASPGDGVLVGKAVLRAARLLGLNNVILANVLGISQSQVSRLDRGKAALDGKPLEIALLLIRVFRSLSGIVGPDDDAAKSWMRADNTALRGRPCDLIQRIDGLVSVMTYLDSHRARL
ncbi:antitoxin Xre/MbcA/ParS toxin-binding domain-containing protein [uncultured Rhodospira sp.]|uniref:MbcA/ParS/Xre antitoxin family protein n=1 Tax=uncultured Rhodospira sp. TaxID=1936189 RepID=UPI00260FD6F4|nr:antitoxin Xre/MbcA/ParS toxin-binding domain-containing protein [uncultured Rhodospira sp.]